MSETPRRLGRYQLIRRIAVGGMGEIYIARAEGTAGFEKTVIIKTILPHLAEEEEFVEKFLDEGRIVVNLTHGNIVPVFDMDEADGEYFIAMEYVPGRDVREVLARLRKRGERMPPDLAAYIVSEVCEGLGYAHQKTDDQGNPLDIVHRDVSPSNILISTDGEVKIIDFGVARAADRRAKTVSGRIQGKCCYMSPEQAKGESLDHRSDIFSTGTVFYEMLTCVRPFEGASDLKSLDLVRECEFDPPSLLEPTVPEELDEVVERALAEEPEDRYQKIDDMKVDLMEYLVERGRAVTSEEVAEFLAALFPEGLEREDFREVREQAKEPSGPMGLDDALEYQLDQLGDDGIDPHEQTMPEGERDDLAVGEMGRTETLTPDSGMEEDAAETASEISPEEPPTDPERPDAKRDEPSMEASSGAPGETEEVEDQSSLPWSLVATVAGAVLVVAAAVMLAFAGVEKGRVEIQTDPRGATVLIDGEELDAKTTPSEVRLAPGEHTLEVKKEGYETERREFALSEDETKSYTIDLDATDRRREKQPREFALRTVPSNASIWVNNREVGHAPQTIEVAPGETKFVAADREGCERARMPVYYGRGEEVVRIELECDTDGGDEEPSGRSEGTGGTPGASRGATRGPGSRSRRVEVEFRSTPEGASVSVGGEAIGETPTSKQFERGATLQVRFEKTGHEPVERTVGVSSLDDGVVRAKLPGQKNGCLDFFAVHPQYNEIAIDGEWLEGRHQKLENYELSPGPHKIRVRNPDAGKDETFSFEVEPGKDCTSLTVWDPDDG